MVACGNPNMLRYYLLFFAFVLVNGQLKFLAPPFNGASNSLYVHLRDNVSISCQTNTPNAKLTVDMRVDRIKQKLIWNEQNFTVYQVNIHNTGKIICKAETANESISLTLGVLRVNKYACVEHPVISPNILVQKYEKNENFSIVCEAPGGKIDLMWSRDNIKIDSTTQLTRRLVKKTVQFTLANKNISGTYTCTRMIRNCKDDQTTYNTIQLNYIQPYKPIISELNLTSHSVQKEFNITLKCLADGSPRPNILWLRNKQVLHSCSHSKQCDLVLRNVMTSNNYTCVASNTEGTTSLKHSLIVLVPPTAIQGNHDSNRGRMLACEANGYPIPLIYWQQQIPCTTTKCVEKWNNVSGVSFKVTSSVDKSEIEFLDRNTHGTFRCVASNSVGEGTVIMVLPKNSPDSLMSKSAIVAIVLSISTIFILCICIILCYRKHMMKKYAPYMYPDPKFQLDPDRTLFQQSIELPYDAEWEFPRDRLQLIRSLGSGAFGQVWLAHARGVLALSPRDKDSMAIRRRTRLRMNKKVPKSLINCFLDDDLCEQNIFVAVKTLKSDASNVEYKDLASEIKVLIHLGAHDNIVNLLGACTKDGSLCAIMEFCPYGNLVNFLRERRDIFSLQWARQGENYNEDFCFLDATHVAYQVARGMQFLAEKKLVHRDLAARNILVGNDYVIKIADFGLTRDIEKNEFYLKESGGMLPVKWMAPESLFDKLYTVKSDVWSFGIVLWEISTMGGSPYPGLPMENLFEYLRHRNRMEKPGTCPDELYDIMTQCWSENMNERPYFNELVGILEALIKSKAVISDNLAAFERLQSCSDETDYLVPKSPMKLKKGSLDTMLGLSSFPSPRSAHRKRSAADVMIRFPPMDDSINAANFENNNSSKLEDKLDNPTYANRYVDLQTSDRTENNSSEKDDENDSEDTKF